MGAGVRCGEVALWPSTSRSTESDGDAQQHWRVISHHHGRHAKWCQWGAFTKQSDTCTGDSVAAGATCTVTVALQPTRIGTFTATLSFADSAPGNPQTVALTGYGVAPSISLPQRKVAIGATYALSGTGFAPMETVRVTWDTASGTALGSAQADAHGTITLQVTIPHAKLAPHMIVAVGQASMVGATVSVTVVPAKAAP